MAPPIQSEQFACRTQVLAAPGTTIAVSIRKGQSAAPNQTWCTAIITSEGDWAPLIWMIIG